MMAYAGAEVQLHSFWTPALDGDERSASHPGRSTHKEAGRTFRRSFIPNLKLSRRLNSIKYRRDRSSKRRVTRHSTWRGCLPENILLEYDIAYDRQESYNKILVCFKLVAKSLRQRILNITPTPSFLIQYPKIILVAENFLVSQSFSVMEAWASKSFDRARAIYRPYALEWSPSTGILDQTHTWISCFPQVYPVNLEQLYYDRRWTTYTTMLSVCNFRTVV